MSARHTPTAEPRTRPATPREGREIVAVKTVAEKSPRINKRSTLDWEFRARRARRSEAQRDGGPAAAVATADRQPPRHPTYLGDRKSCRRSVMIARERGRQSPSCRGKDSPVAGCLCAAVPLCPSYRHLAAVARGFSQEHSPFAITRHARSALLARGSRTPARSEAKRSQAEPSRAERSGAEPHRAGSRLPAPGIDANLWQGTRWRRGRRDAGESGCTTSYVRTSPHFIHTHTQLAQLTSLSPASASTRTTLRCVCAN